jgi:hypothetical protein
MCEAIISFQLSKSEFEYNTIQYNKSMVSDPGIVPMNNKQDWHISIPDK